MVCICFHNGLYNGLYTVCMVCICLTNASQAMQVDWDALQRSRRSKPLRFHRWRPWRVDPCRDPRNFAFGQGFRQVQAWLVVHQRVFAIVGFWRRLSRRVPRTVPCAQDCTARCSLFGTAGACSGSRMCHESVAARFCQGRCMLTRA